MCIHTHTHTHIYSHSVVSDSLRPPGMQHTMLPYPSPTPRACSNSCPLSWWCHPTISSSVVPFSSCSQSFPASGSFLKSQFFPSGGQSIGASASASVLSRNIHWNISLEVSLLFSAIFPFITGKSKSEVAQLCLTLLDPMDCSLPDSSINGILQVRVPEWVAISFSRGSSWPGDWTQVSHTAGRGFTVWATREAGGKEEEIKTWLLLLPFFIRHNIHEILGYRDVQNLSPVGSKGQDFPPSQLNGIW